MPEIDDTHSFLPDLPAIEDVIPPPVRVPALSKAAENVRKIVESPTGKTTAQTVSTAGVITATVGGIIRLFANPFTFGELFSLPFRLWSLFLSFIGLRKKYKPWGVVYDSFTKRPIDPAYVVLMDLQGHKISTSITDLDGRYGFLINPGNYRMIVNKTNYIFPSESLSGKTNDELYSNLYFGEEIHIDENNLVISRNIPMDPVDFDWNEFAKKENRLMKFYSRFDVWFYRFTEVMFYAGFAVALVVLIITLVPYNIIIFGLYILMSILRFFGLKPRKNGHVTEKETGDPISFALIRIFTPGIDQEISKRTTDAYGRYFALVPKGQYYVSIERKNQDGTYTHLATSELLKAKNGIISKDFSI